MEKGGRFILLCDSSAQASSSYDRSRCTHHQGGVKFGFIEVEVWFIGDKHISGSNVIHFAAHRRRARKPHLSLAVAFVPQVSV